jgi:hypothetical protein
MEHYLDRPEGRSSKLAAVLVGKLAGEAEQSRDLVGLEDDGRPAACRAAVSVTTDVA